jgi:two-component system, OmpR family, heavy metal sensor histidine kinase CusS
MTLPIRLRLTAWYLTVLSLTLATCSLGTYFVIKAAIHRVIDQELASRLLGIHKFLWNHLPWQSGEALLREFREHSGLTPGGDLYQVQDAEQQWVYQPLAMKKLNVEADSVPTKTSHYETIERRGTLLRVLTARVEVADRIYTVQVATVTTAFDLLLTRLRFFALVILPIIIVCSGFGGYWLSGRAMAPIDSITRAAQQISERNLSKRLPLPEARDELRRLSETLNSMLSRLEVAFKRIVQFTADASHELRTPVAIIRTTAELINEQRRTVEEYEEANAQIISEAERTTGLIDDLLILARSDAQAMQFAFSDVDLLQIVNDVVTSMTTLADAKGVQLITNSSRPATGIVGDCNAIRRLITVLVDNAIKYSSAGSTVLIGVGADPNAATVEVKDEGIGISEQDLQHIFERFYRADKARSREMGGAGLGLSIAKSIADVHRARISVESEIGKGSSFKVSFPVISYSPA